LKLILAKLAISRPSAACVWVSACVWVVWVCQLTML